MAEINCYAHKLIPHRQQSQLELGQLNLVDQINELNDLFVMFLSNQQEITFLQYVYLIYSLLMLDQRDVSKFLNSLIIAMASKTTLFLILLIFLVAKKLTGFGHDNPYVCQCHPYINIKTSFYLDKNLIAQFFMALFGFIASTVNLTLFAVFVILLRNQNKQKTSQKIRLSQNRLRSYFSLTFIEAICTISVFSRSIEKVNQQNVCTVLNRTDFIVLIALSFSILCILAAVTVVLFKLLELMKVKYKSLKQFDLYSEQITLQENLLFNKTGYIKELLKLENYSSRSSSLREEVLKDFPSGFKKKDEISANRQIVFRLRGGNKSGQNKNQKQNQKKQDQDEEFEFEFKQSKDTKNQKLTTPKSGKSNLIDSQNKNRLDLLKVNQKTYEPSPNDQNYETIELFRNVIELSINNKIFSNFNNIQEEQSEQEEEQPNFNRSEDRELQKRRETPNRPQQKAGLQLKLEQELRQKFNLTPNPEGRKKYGFRQNQQHIDENGNYYFVDLERIKKRSKYLDTEKLLEELNQSKSFDPNTLYSQTQWIPRQKRLPKKHQKNVTQFLKNLQQTRRQQMLIQEHESSSYSESFDSSSQSSEFSDSQPEQQIPTQPISIIDPITGQQFQTVPQKKKTKRNIEPQLYLHLKQNKRYGANLKLKLYEEEDAIYESQSSNQSQQPNPAVKRQGQKGIEVSFNKEKPSSKEQQGNKQEEKIILTNKRLNTSEGRMLRFIRKKYLNGSPEQKKYQPSNITLADNYGVSGYTQKSENQIQVFGTNAPGQVAMNHPAINIIPNQKPQDLKRADQNYFDSRPSLNK